LLRQFNSPPAFVALIAAANVRHGESSEQLALSTPDADTNVRWTDAVASGDISAAAIAVT
jgi:hypothetical protein